MSQTDLKIQRRNTGFDRLIAMIGSADNIIDIFAEAAKQLKAAIQCDWVTIVLNHEQGRYFYLPATLNQTEMRSKEVIIPYKETIFSEILRFHRPIIRNNLLGRGKLTPGDLKILPANAQSDITVPIIIKNKVRALINLSSSQAGYFSKAHQKRTTTIASLLGLALERSELIEKLNQQQADLVFWKQKVNALDISQELLQLQVATIHEILSLIGSPMELDEIIKQILMTIHNAISFDYAQLCLFNDNYEYSKNYTVISDRLRQCDQQKSWHILESHESFWYNISLTHVSQQLNAPENQDALESKNQSWLSTALSIHKRYLGTIVIGGLEPHRYQKYQVELLHHLAQYAAMVIDYVRLANEDDQKVVDSSVQKQLSDLIGFHRQPDRLLQNFAQICARILAAQLATVHQIEPQLSLSNISVSDPNLDRAAILNFERNYVLPKALTATEPFMLDQLSYDDLEQKHIPVESIPYHIYLTNPLKTGTKVIGLLTIYWDKPHQLTAKETWLTKYLAHWVTDAIERINFLQETRGQLEQLEECHDELKKFLDVLPQALKIHLASIQGLACMLLDHLQEKIAEDHYKYLERIYGSAVKAQCLINDVIELSNIGRNNHSVTEINMTEIVTQVIGELMPTLKRKGIKLSVEDKLPTVDGDRGYLAQVFRNLIENAIKNFNEHHKKPTIKIGFRSEASSDVFFVRDNGMGIKRKLQDQVFRLPQEQGEDAMTGVSGLKLAIVKKIIDLHQGKIWLESEESKGSSVYFSLPKVHAKTTSNETT